jgi:hypothetical protein
VHYGRYGHPTGSCVGVNPIGVTTFLAEDRKAFLGVLGLFLGVFLRMGSRLRAGVRVDLGYYTSMAVLVSVRDLLSLTRVHARELSGAAQARLRLALGASL